MRIWVKAVFRTEDSIDIEERERAGDKVERHDLAEELREGMEQLHHLDYFAVAPFKGFTPSEDPFPEREIPLPPFGDSPSPRDLTFKEAPPPPASLNVPEALWDVVRLMTDKEILYNLGRRDTAEGFDGFDGSWKYFAAQPPALGPAIKRGLILVEALNRDMLSINPRIIPNQP